MRAAAAGGMIKLRVACEKFGINTDDITWHTAMDDAIATLRLAAHLRREGREGERGRESASLVPSY